MNFFARRQRFSIVSDAPVDEHNKNKHQHRGRTDGAKTKAALRLANVERHGKQIAAGFADRGRADLHDPECKGDLCDFVGANVQLFGVL